MRVRTFTAAAIALLALAWGLLPEFSVVILCYIGLYALVALGLVLLTGVGGMTSFGQAAFVGVGAYATAWVCSSAAPLHGMLPAALLPWAGLLLGLALNFALAWVLGSVTVKLQGHYLPLCTIAWGLGLYYLFGNMPFLGGHTGMGGIPALHLGPFSLGAPRAIGVLIWALVLLAVWLLHHLLDSRSGRAIRALKSGPVMAESVGVDTARQRLKLFVLAALLASLSGWLYAHMQRFVSPAPFGLHVGIEYLFMAVLGGSAHLWGAVLGAALITLVKQKLQDFLPALLGAGGNFEIIAFGILMVLVLQRFADGLWPGVQRFAARWLPPPAHDAPLVPTSAAPLAQRPPLPAGQVLLAAEGLSQRFGALVANERIDLDVRAGEIHALIGPNGAGKSTFFDMISGITTPADGTLYVLGQRMHAGAGAARRFAALGLARSFQHVRLMAQRSVLENVALGAHTRARRGWLAAMLRLERKEENAVLATARQHIARCGLQVHTHSAAGTLALGQQRMVEMARALAADPLLLLLDEPAAGLRHMEKQALADMLRQLRTQGLGILLVEHDMEFVMQLADRVTVLEFGRVIARGSPAQVQADARVRDAYLGGDADDDAADEGTSA